MKKILTILMLAAGLAVADEVPYFDLYGVNTNMPDYVYAYESETNAAGNIPCGWILEIVTTTANGLFSITPTAANNMKIYWGDGAVSNYTGSSRVDHYYADAGTYMLQICDGTVTRIVFGHDASSRQLLKRSVSTARGVDNLTSLVATFYLCGNLVTMPYNMLEHATNVTTLYQTWDSCSSATTLPNVDMLAGVISLIRTWRSCSSATNFPDISALTKVSDTMDYLYQGCTNCTTFPAVNTLTNVTGMLGVWMNCPKQTNFQDISTLTKVTTFEDTWYNNTEITGSIPNFSLCTAVTDFRDTFYGLRNIVGDVSHFWNHTNVLTWNSQDTSITYTNRGDWVYWPRTNLRHNATFSMTRSALDQDSVSQVLIDLDASGATNGVSNMDGTGAYSNANPNAAGMTAVTNLRAKAWTVTINE